MTRLFCRRSTASYKENGYVEAFFKSQVQVYDAAVKMLDDLSNQLDYISHEEEANKALNRIRLLVLVQNKFDYNCIPELNTLMKTV